MGQRTKASREAAAAAAPQPPPPPAGGTTAAEPKTAPAAGAVTKPVAPTRPAAPAPAPAPVQETSPPATTGERRYGAASPFGVSTLQDQPSYVPRQVTRETTLPLRMPEYEQRLARVREMGKSVPRPGPVTFEVSPKPGAPARTISTNPFTSDAPASQYAKYAARPSPEDMKDPGEFARQAERLGARYAALQSSLQELEQLRRKYELERKSQPFTVGELSRRNPLEVLAGRTPIRDVDRKLAEVARRTRAANADTARTIADLQQYGFTDQDDVERTFGDLVPTPAQPATDVPATLGLPAKR